MTPSGSFKDTGKETSPYISKLGREGFSTFTTPATYPLVNEGTFRWQMGVRPKTGSTPWLTAHTPDVTRVLSHKHAMFSRHRQQVSAHLPFNVEAQREVLDAVVSYFEAHDPARLASWHPHSRELSPLETAAHLTAEDLLVLSPTPSGLVLTSAVVCLPNKWDLLEKIGKTIEEIHAPVPQLNEQLQRKISTFLNALKPDKQYWRVGWGLATNPDPYQPSPQSPDLFGGAAVYVRLERETFTRLPVSNSILFTIATNVIPVDDLDLDLSPWKDIFSSLGTIPEDIAAYKNIDHLKARFPT